MLTSVVLYIIFVFVDRSFSVEAKEICTNDRSASIMESLLKLVKEIQQHSKGRNCDDYQKNPVAFYAGLTKHTSLSGSQTIVYDKIYTNLGQAYDPNNGNFRAPVNGIYYFSCSLLSYSGSFHFILMKNNDRLGKGYGDEGSDSGSVTGTVILSKGDVMSVQHHPGGGSQKVHGDEYSTFTGYLITTL
ncbi:complement C1q-like protein 3 [Mytilus galloprovincialis]|uniref:complement C1q-like protein 3 n=1 Tax=Mytilus galloprovincialis TaxID=29158 RepID=UPI003F7BE46D